MPLDTDKPSLQATVVVVTDDHTEGDNLTRVLVRQGMTVLRADTGAQCWELVRTHPVDVVLLDVKMSGIECSTFCKELTQISPAPPMIRVNEDDLATWTARALARALEAGEQTIAVNARGDTSLKISDHAGILARLQAHLSIRRGEQEADRGSAAIEPPTPPTRADRGSAVIEPTKAPSTILIVNDNPDSVEIFAAILIRKSGMHVHVLKAYNGVECLEILRTHTVDLILLDDYMPVMGGLAVCAALQHTAAPPIIFMTTDTVQLEAQLFPTVTPAKREAALRLGAREAVAIPIMNRADFFAQIRRLINDR